MRTQFRQNTKLCFLKRAQLFFFTSICCSVFAFAQTRVDIEKRVASFPKNIQTTQALATAIEEEFKNPTAQSYALYTWLAKNIRYDLKTFRKGLKPIQFSYRTQEELKRKIQAQYDALTQETLKSRKAVCEGYARTFERTASLLGIECAFISGLAKTSNMPIGKPEVLGRHAWNAVKLDNKWYLLDCTWGAGYSISSKKWQADFNPYYCFTEPGNFVKKHYPKDEKWQLLAHPISKKSFSEFPAFGNLYYKQKLQLLSPENGYVAAKKKKYLDIVFEKERRDIAFGYIYSRERYYTKIKPIFQNGKTILRIPAKRKRTLNILSGNEIVLSFETK